jgi:hypothetical protein
MEGEAGPVVILPADTGINYLRRSVDAFGLKSRSRIRPLLLPIQSVKILVAGIYILGYDIMITPLILIERYIPLPWRENV